MVKTRLYGQNQVFQNILDILHDLPHIFLTGVPGCGKTTFLEDLMELIKEKNMFRIESILWLSSEKIVAFTRFVIESMISVNRHIVNLILSDLSLLMMRIPFLSLANKHFVGRWSNMPI